jgi:hypothetical protein
MFRLRSLGVSRGLFVSWFGFLPNSPFDGSRPDMPGLYLGVTEAISIAGPTEMDCIKTRELEKVSS